MSRLLSDPPAPPARPAGRRWGRTLSQANLVEMARAIRFSLSSGMMLRDAMRLLAAQGTRRVRAVARGIVAELEAGWSFQEALAKHSWAFPPLFLALAEVGEESGNLPEVMLELEKYYEVQRRLRRDFLSDITWPIVQFVAAVLIVAGLIYILGSLPPTRVAGKAEPLDPLGLGLVGRDGAVRFLAYVGGGVAALAGLFLLLRLALRRRAVVERALLGVPLLGPALRAIALTRFCVALQIMLESGMSVVKTVRLAFAATDNPAFTVAAPRALAVLQRGGTITSGLGQARRFPAPFLSAVAIGEESGRLPEVLRIQAEYYDEIARRRLAVLNKALGGLVWLVVAAFVITLILRIVTVVYVGNLNKFAT